MSRSPDHLLSEGDRGRAGGHQGLTVSHGRRLSLLSWRHWTCFPAADPTCVSLHLVFSPELQRGPCWGLFSCLSVLQTLDQSTLTAATPHLLQGPPPPPATFSWSPRPTGSWTLLQSLLHSACATRQACSAGPQLAALPLGPSMAPVGHWVEGKRQARLSWGLKHLAPSGFSAGRVSVPTA